MRQHFSRWVELVDVAEANIGQRRAASLIMDFFPHLALHVIIALSVTRGMKLGGTRSCRDRCTAVKPLSDDTLSLDAHKHKHVRPCLTE